MINDMPLLLSPNMPVSLSFSPTKYEEALKFYREALDNRKQILCPDHPDTFGTMHNIAVALNSQKK